MVLAGRYELMEIIGRGGHGTVWRANDRDTGRAVAVKMLNDVAASDPQQIERLKREQLAMVSLAGTSAVGFVDLVKTPAGKLCLVMELLEGIDLEQRLEDLEHQGSFIETAELLRALAPIVDTLERAHQAGILHRDLKPANVFLMSSAAGGGVRLLDFGLARMRAAQPLTAAGMIVGSPSYIAPEVWKGRPDALDQRVDIYSFGVLVFRALANRLPFEGTTLQDKFRLTTTAPRPSLIALRPDLPADMDDWVAQVLSIDPDDRFFGIRGTWNALLASLHAPDFAEQVATASDLQSAIGTVAPLAAPATTFAEHGGERSFVSDWLARSTYADENLPPVVDEPLDHAGHVAAPFGVTEPPPIAPPPPTEALRSTSAADGKVMIAKVVAVAGDPSARASGEKSFVREWLAGSELTAPSEADASTDVASWLGVHEDAPAGESAPRRPAPKPPRPAKKRAAKAPAKKPRAKTRRKRKAAKKRKK